MKVLQLFHRYLDESSNWIFHQLKYMNHTDLSISTPVFINQQYLNLKARFIRPLYTINPDLPDHFGLNSLRKFNEFFWKRKVSSELNEFDLIHIHFGGFACKHLNWLIHSGKPFVVSLYGYDYLQLPQQNKVIGKLYPLMLEKASAILVEGPHGQKYLADHWEVPLHKIRVAPLGIELPNNKPIPCPLQNEPLRWLQIASFKKKKGQDLTIKAFAKYSKDRPHDILTFVGNGQEQKNCKLLVNELGLSNQVIFIDRVPHRELPQFMTDYDVFIHPSRQTADGDTEGGAPVIILEAQAIGLPVISTFHADIPNIVLNDETGFLAEENSVDDLVSVMRKFADLNQLQLIQMKQKAIQWIYEHFDAKICAQNIESIYEESIRKN